MRTKLLSPEEHYAFCSQLNLILTAGLPLNDGLETMYEQDQSQEYIQLINRYINDGLTLFEALCKTEVFEKTFLYMVEVGEQTGYLDNVMEAMALYYRRMRDTNEKIKELMFYPVLLSILILVIMGIVVFKITPIFHNLFNSMDALFSTSSLTLMQLGKNIGIIGFVALAVISITLTWYCSRFFFKQELTSFRLPFAKQLQRKLALSQFTYATSLLISSGYRIEDSLSILTNIVHYPSIKQQLLQCEVDMKNGKSFEEALIEVKLYSGIHARLLHTGFKSGNSDAVLKHLSILHEEEFDDALHHYLNRLEPAMIVTLSIFIALLLISVMLPLLSLLMRVGS